MNQKTDGNTTLQHDNWLIEVLKAERAILDGQMPATKLLQAIPADIRMKSPLLLRAECEDGLLNGRLIETKQRLEAALRGFAAQADESAMLTMMAMLGLLYMRVGDRQEAGPFMAQLAEEWNRTPEQCSGFVPWALARAAATIDRAAADYAAEAQRLFQAAAERFRKEGKPVWAAFVLLEQRLFDHTASEQVDWQLWMSWLMRHASGDPHGAAVVRVLMAPELSESMCGTLPARYAYLSQAILMDAPSTLPPELAADLECCIYAAGARIKQLLEERQTDQALRPFEQLDRMRRLVTSPSIERLTMRLAASLAAAGLAEVAELTVTEEPAASASRDAGRPLYEEAASSSGQPEAAKWRARLFGGINFTMMDGSVFEPIWKRRKAGELFVYLLLQPNFRANREQVIDRVFGEGDLSKRSNQLYVTLHDLRSSLKELGMPEDLIYAKRGVIGVAENGFDAIDVEDYNTLTRIGDQLWVDDREEASRLYDKAKDMYGLLGTELPQAEWLERVREQLLDRQTNMIKRLAVYYGELQDEARVEQCLADWIALRPEQEEAYEAMIIHCLRGERRIEAISWYRRLERICKEELGSEPLEEVRKLLWK
ncbi:DNA-binding SARP family transcriptional activator [Paenibacillus taihuensis]|uniref:DNA-binding SARP family transcriptional activator n=1 Tax=Paenibacillus taihuensis TaxID=1156355 RepID=A0A3D9S320_9BACL|nr:BTAD domain-containing putative transcriptional regulator [Paenibacillus taihuensis]REE84541.1 DNA-binding SARP family transcriptional activator [Paenibacillus taihuensis]